MCQTEASQKNGGRASLPQTTEEEGVWGWPGGPSRAEAPPGPERPFSRLAWLEAPPGDKDGMAVCQRQGRNGRLYMGETVRAVLTAGAVRVASVRCPEGSSTSRAYNRRSDRKPPKSGRGQVGSGGHPRRRLNVKRISLSIKPAPALPILRSLEAMLLHVREEHVRRAIQVRLAIEVAGHFPRQ